MHNGEDPEDQALDIIKYPNAARGTEKCIYIVTSAIRT